MSIPVPDTIFLKVLETLKDVRVELDAPEVAELTSLALDRKIDQSILALEVLKNYEEEI